MDPYRSLGLKILCLWVVSSNSAFAMQPCPSQDELLANAKVVIEARVKSLSISPSGLLIQDLSPTQALRADLEIKRVIKGALAEKEVVIYGTSFDPGPFRELAIMALIYGAEGHDTFEWELSRVELNDSQTAYYHLGSCNYYKFPDFEELGNDP